MTVDISLEELRKAQGRLKGVLHHTQIERSNLFSSMSGGDVFLKCENQQKTGSFKIRGASNKIAKMIESGKKCPVVASSAGNHAQGVACAATKFGLKSTIVMPITAPLAKVEATRGYGAEVVLSGTCYDDAYAKACEICEKEGAEFIHPYDDIDVIIGQGTLGLDIMDDLPDVDIVVAPAGGGGLLSGLACAIKHINPKVKVYGVQAEGADAIAQSFAKKKKITTESTNTIADGIAVKNPGDITVELINKYVDGVVTVSDDEIADTILLLMERSKEVVESAGASSVAAVINNRIDVKGKKVVCVLSGGNIDFSLIGNLIERGLIARHRRIEIDAIIKDGPGSLEKFMEEITKSGGVIRTIQTNKMSTYIKPNESRVYVYCEINDLEQRNAIANNLRSKGYVIVMSDEYNIPEIMELNQS